MLRVKNFALRGRLHEIGEGMEEVGFSGLERLKGKDLLRVGEEIYAIRRSIPMTPSFPLNEVKDELRDFRSRDDNKTVRVFDSFFSHSESDFNDKLGDAFEENCHQGQLTEDGGPFEASDSWFIKDP